MKNNNQKQENKEDFEFDFVPWFRQFSIVIFVSFATLWAVNHANF